MSGLPKLNKEDVVLIDALHRAKTAYLDACADEGIEGLSILVGLVSTMSMVISWAPEDRRRDLVKLCTEMVATTVDSLKSMDTLQ